MPEQPMYRVLTYDWDLGEFTPQIGVPEGPYTLFGLRPALRALRELGYEVTRHGGISVLVEKV